MTQNILEKTIDNGVIENVQIAPIGTFNGSRVDGSAIEEKITVEKLEQLAGKLNNSDEVLCDIDHSSCKAGAEKNSKAAGWFSRWIVDPIKGLFATLSLTKYGRELLENREYRYTSPVFTLNEDGTVEDLHSVALTNVPAFRGHIQPILNNEANEILTDEKDILSMDINELKKLILDVISEMKVAEEKTEAVEEIKEEIKETEAVEEVVENTACETTEEIKNEETTEEISEEKTEEVVEEKIETTNEVPVEETEKVEEKEEVIKIESLNSAPMIKDVEPEWKKLKGKEFLDWASKNPHYQI